MENWMGGKTISKSSGLRGGFGVYDYCSVQRFLQFLGQSFQSISYLIQKLKLALTDAKPNNNDRNCDEQYKTAAAVICLSEVKFDY